eukprot:GHRR01030565.1.p1 GENE.GHRR01030565.1~~GHRR01030565.1.p1  ORF type:complete len:192 (+),score=60.56 GHRR01030565.1:534-1109(+)
MQMVFPQALQAPCRCHKAPAPCMPAKLAIPSFVCSHSRYSSRQHWWQENVVVRAAGVEVAEPETIAARRSSNGAASTSSSSSPQAISTVDKTYEEPDPVPAGVVVGDDVTDERSKAGSSGISSGLRIQNVSPANNCYAFGAPAGSLVSALTLASSGNCLACAVKQLDTHPLGLGHNSLLVAEMQCCMLCVV